MLRIFSSAVFIVVLTMGCEEKNNPVEVDLTVEPADTIENKTPDNIRFGFNLDDYEVYYDTVQNGWTMSHMLLPHGLSQYEVNVTSENARDSLVGLNYIVSGRPFMVLKDPEDTLGRAQYLVYEPDVFSYVIFDFTQDTIQIKRSNKNILITERVISGEIEKNSNLSFELSKNFDSYNMTAALADAIEGVFAWSIDFFKLQVGDQFVVNYEEKSVDETPYAVKRIKSIWFNHKGDGMYAFYFTTDSTNNIAGYYDDEAREMKRPFLMSPVKFARISSGYNLNRVHPIYKRRKAHLGTDYAAPTGTPILATGDGTVIKASRSRGNGIYVKIRHNGTYETQYLHMSKRADGIRTGQRVQQGQTIGYVGSTGAATGPHVCYRFWKNGRQVNHRAEKFPSSEPMKKELIPDYMEFIKPLKKELDQHIQQDFSNS